MPTRLASSVVILVVELLTYLVLRDFLIRVEIRPVEAVLSHIMSKHSSRKKIFGAKSSKGLTFQIRLP